MSNAIMTLHSNMNYTLACCGLDPDWKKMPPELTQGKTPSEDLVKVFLRGVIDAVAPHVCAFKAQKAFFDLWPAGHNLLGEVISYIHQEHPSIPVIVDCKIGDIDNTMSAYIDNLFGLLNADGIVVNPYMGDAVMQPLIKHANKAIVVLVKTSNPDGDVIQDLRLDDGSLLWERVLHYTIHRWNSGNNMIPVISSTVEVNLSKVRAEIPDQMPVLLAGVGAQGGSFVDLRQMLNSKNSGVFVNSSRGLIYPKRLTNESWQEATARVARELKIALEKARTNG